MIQAARIKAVQAIKPIAGIMRIHSPMPIIKVRKTQFYQLLDYCVEVA